MDLDNRLTISTLNLNGCLNMLRMMLKRMAKEFRHSYREYLMDPTDDAAYGQYARVREEFLSDYFTDITLLDGKWIVKKLEESVQRDIEQCA